MSVDYDKTTASYYEAGYASTNVAKSKSEREKAKYIQKEKVNRQKMMANDNNDSNRSFLEMTYPQHRMPSLSMQSTGTDTDFTDNDWTPQDSSYGAAFPFCGWVPKSIRQAVEKAMIFLAGFLVIYAIVSIAILLTGDGERKKAKTTTYNYDDNFFTDDNFYVNDNAMTNDDGSDDYYR